MLTRRLIVLVAAALIASPARPQQAAPAGFAPPAAGTVTVYRHVGLIDGKGGALQPDMAVVIDGSTIRSVAPDRQLARAQLKGARTVDLAGRYMLPGLIDSHVHLATPPNRAWAEAQMRRDLYSGITAVRDMADDDRAVAELSRASLVGEIAGPDIYYAALVAGPSFFQDPRTRSATAGAEPGKVPWMQAIDDRTDLPLAIAMARGTYATGLKIYANLPGRLVARLTEEAHRQGMPVWAHGMVFPATPAEVVAAAPDVISHINYLAYQAMAKRPQSYQGRFPIDYSLFANGDNASMTALFRDMRRRGIILDPTIRVYAAREKQPAKPGETPQAATDLAARLTHQAWREGVTLSTGTDGNTARSNPFPALFEELELLQDRAHIPAAEVLRSATSLGAATVAQQRNMGTIEAGKLANLVVVAKNPLENVRNLRTILFTVKRGREFQRSAFRPLTQAEVPDDE